MLDKFLIVAITGQVFWLLAIGDRLKIWFISVIRLTQIYFFVFVFVFLDRVFL